MCTLRSTYWDFSERKSDQCLSDVFLVVQNCGVEWLHLMSCMWKQVEQDNVIFICEVYCVRIVVRAVSIYQG